MRTVRKHRHREQQEQASQSVDLATLGWIDAYAAQLEFPEREPYLYTSQFNIQGRLDPLTDNSHLSTASSLSPSREAVDETKIIKGVSR